MPHPAGPYLSTKDAATYTNHSPQTLEKLRSEGRGPDFYKVGRRVLYARESLDQWIAGHAMTAGANDTAGGAQ